MRSWGQDSWIRYLISLVHETIASVYKELNCPPRNKKLICHSCDGYSFLADIILKQVTVGFFLVRCFNTFSTYKNCVTCWNLDRNHSWPQHFHIQTNVMVLIRILEYLGHIRVSRARNSTIQQIMWIDRNRQSDTKQKRRGVSKEARRSSRIYFPLMQLCLFTN